VSNDELRGATKETAAEIVQWVNFADSDIVPPASTWVFPTLGIMHYNKQATEFAKEEVRRVLGVLDSHLRTQTFLVGERVSLADITVVCALLWLYKQVVSGGGVGVVIGGGWCHHRGVGVAAAGLVSSQWRGCHQEGGRYNSSPPPPPPPNWSWGRPLSPRARGEAERPPCPLAARSPFVLDEFKRKYSNEDTATVALPHFWEHFDKEGWSLWYSEYRFPEELTQTFMSCNLITGMFQRLDKLRKNAFASVILFGTNNDSSISGVWLFRGQELAFPLSPDWQVDYESYTWRKLDSESPECKTLVKEYFSWEGEFKHVGKPFNQGKIFK
ncbi:EF1G factor, partial [Sula dactylatra]|nr:EF1G factor [Sula dactylatra]